MCWEGTKTENTVFLSDGLDIGECLVLIPEADNHHETEQNIMLLSFEYPLFQC